MGINGTTDTLTVVSFFDAYYGSQYGIEQVKFADGTVWDMLALKTKAFTGTAGNDVITGMASSDILQGSAGTDALYGLDGNDLLNGGADNDTIDGGNGSDFLIGGAGNDVIVTGPGADIVAFNCGDGQDTVMASAGQDNTISLGKCIRYADLQLSKNGNDLVLAVGNGEQMTFKDWYAAAANHSVATLQMVIGRCPKFCVLRSV
jgi:Ca2+-binding RTX toxin-like protein